MTLVPLSQWQLCLSCGSSQPVDTDIACCTDRMLLSVHVDRPDPQPEEVPSS